jgi:hypothetical protein
MKKLLRYLNRDLVDLILLIFFVCLLIRALLNDWWYLSPYIIAANIFIIIYILGVMWRMGGAGDLMNEYIRDDTTRRSLGLNIYSLRHRPIRRTPMDWIFRIAMLMISITIFIIAIIL